MLVFDPRLRLTAAQLLDDEIFSAILKPDGKPIRTDEHRAYFEVPPFVFICVIDAPIPRKRTKEMRC